MSGYQLSKHNDVIQDISIYLNLTPQIIPDKPLELTEQKAEIPPKKRELDKNIPRNILSSIQTILPYEEKGLFKLSQDYFDSKCDKLIIGHFYLFCLQRRKTNDQLKDIAKVLLGKIQRMKDRLNPLNMRYRNRIEIQLRILSHLFLENHYGDGWEEKLTNFSWKNLNVLCVGLTQNTQKNQVLTSIKKLRTRQKIVKMVRARLLPNINGSIRVLTQIVAPLHINDSVEGVAQI